MLEPAQRARSVTPATLLIIDDEPQIRRFLGISLRAAGYRVLEAENGAAGLGQLAAGGVDLVILDLGLPDMDGHDVLVGLREFCTMPVLVLTVRADEQEKVKLLDAGANDYLTKPFGLQELLARLRVLLRVGQAGVQAQQPGGYDDGHLRVDLQARLVWLDGEEVQFTRKEYALFEMLITHAGKTLTQPQLLKTVWGPSHAEDTHYLRIAVSKIRSKLKDDPLNPRYLITETGVGLRFRPANGLTKS